MPSIKTNFLRFTHKFHYYQYQAHLLQNYLLEDADKEQLSVFLHNLQNSVLFQYPVLYSPTKLNFNTLSLMLSRGLLINIRLELKCEGDSDKNLQQIFELLNIQILKNTQLLYSNHHNTVFNPFQENKVSDNVSQMPGFSLQSQLQPSGIYIIPVKLSILNNSRLKDPTCRMLLDVSTGTFLLKNDIVRVDKQNSKIFFRNGYMVLQDNLKACHVKSLSSYDFTQKLYEFFQRIKETSNELLSQWSIQIDKKFLQVQHTFIQIGRIAFRGGIEKPIHQIASPLARNSYNHYFRLMFENVTFDDVLQMEMVFFVGEDMFENGAQLVKCFQMIRDRMDLKFSTKIVKFGSLENYQDIILLLSNHTRTHSMHNFILPEQLNPQQNAVINRLKQFLIQRYIYFHIINLPSNSDQSDIIALRHLTLIYTKNRLNPWKMKEIPFGQKPIVIVSLNVQLNCQQKYSIAMICSLNLFLSKFTGIHTVSNESQIEEKIFECLKECLQKFNSVHKAFPYRIFIFRTGFIKAKSVNDEFSIIRNRLTAFYGALGNTKMNTLTYLLLTKLHPLRVYMQLNENSLSAESIKKVQLLCSIQYNHQIYVQLEFEQPIMKLIIVEVQKDPSFIQKVLQLTCRIVFGSVGNQFGKGIGFIGFAEKLNEYRDFNLQGWKSLMKDGIMMFL